mmetsp:Transcript_43097/g.134006  ORF Transcript_43097/g.134006 Transcript_43097/m.134006 type:complete len:188 (+) Transcript_43097:67-630(+)
MQLEGLSLLRKQQPPSSHVYYVPASGGPPAAAASAATSTTAPPGVEEALQGRQQPMTAPPAPPAGSLDPLESAVLEEVKRAVSEPQPTLLRRHTFAGDLRDLKEAARPAAPPLQPDRQRRLAELLLPGLRRELCNAPSEQKGELAEEIAEVQHWLGDDIPNARPFMVGRRCDTEEGFMPELVRSASW